MMGDADTDQQADEVYGQILGEIGMNMNNEMATGSGSIAQPEAAGAAQANGGDADLQARLDALKGL